MPISHTKRFLERWTAQPCFREEYKASPASTLASAKLDVDPAIVPFLVDPDVARRTPGATLDNVISNLPAEVAAYRRFIADKLAFRDQVRKNGAPSQPHFCAWRQRHILRATWDLGQSRAATLVHPPVCFELSDGCTVGCWFCGVSAERFAGNFLYTPENARLWREVLDVVQTECGRGVSQGFCYWATDPFDNPDYEKFIIDFHERLGKLPQTTTALPLRDVERTRRLIALSNERGGRVERFSVLSARIFEEIMETFSPEELLNVELIPQFNNEASPKVIAGASRLRTLRRRSKGKPVEGDPNDGGTIACVTGLLFNMVRRTVRLIGPCSPTEQWPLGYIVFSSFNFSNAEDLRRRLRLLFATAIPISIGRDRLVRFAPRMTLTETDSGFKVASRHMSLSFASFKEGHHLSAMVARGCATGGMIAAERLRRFGIPADDTFRDLAILLEHGALWDEPTATAATLPTKGSMQTAPSWSAEQTRIIEGTWNGVAGVIPVGGSFTWCVRVEGPDRAVELWSHAGPGTLFEVEAFGSTFTLGTDCCTLSPALEGDSNSSASPPSHISVQYPAIPGGADGWVHFSIALFSDATTVTARYYVNGELVATLVGPFGSFHPKFLRVTLVGAGRYSDIRLWSTARTPSDRGQRLDPGEHAGLVAYLPLIGSDTGPMTLEVVSGAMLEWTGTWSETTTLDLADVFREWLDRSSALLQDHAVALSGGGRGERLPGADPSLQLQPESMVSVAAALRALGVGATSAADALAVAFGVRWAPTALAGALTSAGYTPTSVSKALSVICWRAKEIVIADLVARAARDPTFCTALQADSAGVLRSNGVPIPPGVIVQTHVCSAEALHISLGRQPMDPAQMQRSLPRSPTPYQVAMWVQEQVRAGGPLAHQLLVDATGVLAQMGVRLLRGR